LGYDGIQIYRSQQLNLSLTDIVGVLEDTNKPNAVVIFPYHDYNHFGWAFENKPSLDFFNDLQRVYDVKTSIVEYEEKVYTQIRSIPNIELLVLAGHGKQHLLYLGSNGSDETQTLDFGDIEIEIPLSYLNPKAKIFLWSCSTGRGGENEYNLANFLSMMAEGREVISSGEDFNSKQIEVTSFYPFSTEIINSNGAKIDYSTGKY